MEGRNPLRPKHETLRMEMRRCEPGANLLSPCAALGNGRMGMRPSRNSNLRIQEDWRAGRSFAAETLGKAETKLRAKPGTSSL